jgi:hypothetical protein
MAGQFGGGRKFKSQWTTSGDGTKHPSKGEAEWWNGLRLLERAGEIFRLTQNPRWPMYVARDCPYCRDHGELIGYVYGDAEYDDKAGVHHFADFKGGEGETALSKLKRKFVKARFGVDIELVGPVMKQAARAKAKRAAAKTAFAERGKS